MIDRSRVAATVALGAGVTFLGVLAAVVMVVVVAAVDTGFALSDGFFWISVAVAVLVQLGAGTLAGRLTGPRLRDAGVAVRRWRYALAAIGPMLIALLCNLKPVEGVPVVAGILVPVAAAAIGALLGVRFIEARG